MQTNASGSGVPSNQRGAVGVMMPFLLIIIFAIGVLAIDIARLLVVRNELQNAADAAALAGANYLYRPGTTPGSSYDWSSAQSNALSALRQNYAAGAKLIDADVQTGYWNTASNTFHVQPYTPSSNDIPAVKVYTEKLSGKNGGPVRLYLAPVIQLLAPTVSAAAVAVVASPTTITKGGLLPLVVSSCIYNASWDFTKSPPAPKKDSNGSPVIWSFGPGMSGGSSCGDQSLYTSFDDPQKANSAGMQDLFANHNPNPMSIGGNTYVLDQADSVSKVLLPKINQCSAAGDKTCEYSTVTIVNKTDGSAGNQQIVSFACLHILSAHADSGGNYYITAQLSTLCQNSYSGGMTTPSTVYRVKLVL
ncbi:TadG family pilus assembly protein [Ralstonia solanacearum]|uniref:TadG family pilus assembly protein n=1 Tax=Ralstonia solanacearum TaxID=305 RepID=UPI0001D9833A|nr:TadG family pilus assembly protein [Ralstonia solanacearum]CBM10247.1 conserved hypothethical protein [Ralstonia solanacearum PSI07]